FLQQASVPRDYRKPPIDPVDQNLPSQPGPADLLARARSLCGEVLNLSCRNARAYQYLALIAYRAGDYREAEEYFNLACKADPTDGGYLNLGSLYAQTGMLEEAKAMFSLAEKYDRYDARLHIEMANLNLILKQPDAALTSARRAVTCDPESEDSYCALAISLMKSGDYLEAEKILRTALERLDERRSARPRLLLARILVRFGDDDKDTTRYDEALRSVCAAIRINPLEAEPHFCRGIVEFKAENYAQAYRAFEECLSLDPGRFDARRNLDIVKAKRQAEGEKSLVTRWSPLFMWGLCIVAAIMVSLCAFFGWPNAKVDKSTFTVAVPLLLGLAVVSLLLPYLSKLKLPGGFEANIVEHKKEEMISYGPKGDVGFGSSLPAVSRLLARSN
ncbi:MAG TPA: tetratricopeptide repeat protein, partial [Blastocatellia bacterium]|nr:tetratricopeptide repeat protein [Blastocatellia bacterium]